MKTLKEYRAPYLSTLSSFILFLLLQLVPTMWTVYIDFTEWKGIGTPKFCGLRNYQEMVTDDMFWDALGNMVVYWVTGPVMILVLAIVIVCLLNDQALRGRTLFKTATPLPNIRATITMGLISRVLLDENVGLVNELGNTIGFSKIPRLTSTRYPRIPVIILNAWRNTPWFTMIVPSGLLNISRDYYEAATVDGTSNLKQFYYITLPSLKNILFFRPITLTVDNWRLSNESYTLPGPGISNTPLLQCVYEPGSNILSTDYAPAIRCALIVILMIIPMIQFAARRKQDEFWEGEVWALGQENV